MHADVRSMNPPFRLLPVIPDVEDKDLRALTHLIQHPITGWVYRKRFKMVLDLCDVPKRRVLELGFGVGYLAYALAPFTERYYGIDIHQYSRKVEDTLRTCGICNVKLCHADARNLEIIPSHSIDLIVSVSCLEHIKEQNLVQSEVKRILKPHGYAIYGMPIKNSFTHLLFKSVGYNDEEIHPSKPMDTIHFAHENGLYIVEEKFFPISFGHRIGLYWAAKFEKK